MTNAQYEIATYNQYRVKALEKRVEKLESEEAYQELRDKPHAANTLYVRMVKEKDSIIAECRSQAKRARTIWSDEVYPDVVRTYERQLTKAAKRSNKAEEEYGVLKKVRAPKMRWRGICSVWANRLTAENEMYRKDR